MGNNNQKVGPLSIPLLIKQLNSYHLPEDRNGALETIEQVDLHLAEKKTFEAKSKQLKDCEGLQTILKITKKMLEDIEFVAVLTQILDTVKVSIPLVMDFIRFGGIDLVEKAIRIHSADDYIAMMLPRLLNVVLAIGASIAIGEIQNESLNLKLCLKCQEIILKEKNPVGTKEKIVLPKPTDRVNKVIKFMQTYIAREDVQIAALDAVINFSRNPDAKLFTRETEIVLTVSQILTEYIKNTKVLWRGCMAFSILSSISGEVAVDIEHTKMHELLIENYNNYENEPMLQQQILWLLSSFLAWPRSTRQVHKNPKCMEFFKALIEGKDQKMKNQENLQKQKEQDEKKNSLVKGGAEKLAFMAKYNKSVRQEIQMAKERDAEIARANLLTVPVNIRKFMRETNGEVYKERRGPQGRKQEFKARKNFDEKPKFGTVNTTIFVKGEDGLLPGSNDDEDGNEKKDAPEWEKYLNSTSQNKLF